SPLRPQHHRPHPPAPECVEGHTPTEAQLPGQAGGQLSGFDSDEQPQADADERQPAEHPHRRLRSGHRDPAFAFRVERVALGGGVAQDHLGRGRSGAFGHGPHGSHPRQHFGGGPGQCGAAGGDGPARLLPQGDRARDRCQGLVLAAQGRHHRLRGHPDPEQMGAVLDRGDRPQSLGLRIRRRPASAKEPTCRPPGIIVVTGQKLPQTRARVRGGGKNDACDHEDGGEDDHPADFCSSTASNRASARRLTVPPDDGEGLPHTGSITTPSAPVRVGIASSVTPRSEPDRRRWTTRSMAVENCEYTAAGLMLASAPRAATRLGTASAVVAWIVAHPPSWPVLRAVSMSLTSAPRHSPTTRRSGRIRRALRTRSVRVTSPPPSTLACRAVSWTTCGWVTMSSRASSTMTMRWSAPSCESWAPSGAVVPVPAPPEMRMFARASTASASRGLISSGTNPSAHSWEKGNPERLGTRNEIVVVSAEIGGTIAFIRTPSGRRTST